MLCICEPLNAEEGLIVDIGIEGCGVANRSPVLGAINRVTDIRAGGEIEGGSDDIYSNIPSLNRSFCRSSEHVRVIEPRQRS